MSCSVLETTLALLVEGDLADPEARRLEEHLAACADCQTRRSRLLRSQRVLRTLRDAPLDELAVQKLHATVMDAVAAEPGPAPMRPAWWWRVAAAAATLILGTLTAWRVLTPGGPEDPPAPTEVAAHEPAASLAAPHEALPSPPPRLAGNAGPRRPEIPLNAEAAVLPAPPAEAIPSSGGAPAPRSPAPGFAGRASAPRVALPDEGVTEPEPVMSPPLGPPRLSDRDADQLAAALLAVSAVETLPRDPAARRPRTPPSGTLVRLTTADPNVVIYWQLDSNGG